MNSLPPTPTQHLPEKEAENLWLVCREVGLSDAAAEELAFTAVRIRFSEAHGEGSSATRLAPSRRKELDHVASLASHLCEALQRLSYEDRSAVHEGFKGLPIRIVLDPPNHLREVFLGIGGASPLGHKNTTNMRDVMCENVLLLGDVLLTLEGVTRNASKHVAGQEVGRPKRNSDLAYYVSMIAPVAHKHGVTVGRGGPFHRLCEAIFQAAGIATDPDSAIRKCLSFYPSDYLLNK